MAMTVGFWVIPVILTAVTAFWPVDKGADHYGAASTLVTGAKLIIILSIWLVFFAVSYFLG